ncbi:MAG: S8/S53 family peptidase [Actinomycetota bacterium]
MFLFARCTADVITACRYIQESEPRFDGEVEVRGETRPFADRVVYVRPGQADPAIDALRAAGAPGAAEIDLGRPDEVATYFNQFHCAGNERALTGDDLQAVVATDIWQAVVGDLELLRLPEGVEVRDAVVELTEAGIEASPVAVLGTQNHFGAMPGPDAQHDEELAGLGSGLYQPWSNGGPVIAVIDTGFYGHAGVEKGTGLPERRRTFPRYEAGGESISPTGGSVGFSFRQVFWTVLDTYLNRKSMDGLDDYRFDERTCRASHGEFVASVVRQIEPSAVIHGVNAFMLRQEPGGEAVRCWETTDLAVAFSLARLEQSRIDFDAVNMSLGTVHHDHDSPESPWALDAIFVDGPDLDRLGQIFASAGNTEEVVRSAPFELLAHPAAYSGVTAVGAMSEDESWVLWERPGDEYLPLRGPDRNQPNTEPYLAPGCNLMAHATEDPNETVLWSGSSFASPVVAGLYISGAWSDRDVDYVELPGPMEATQYYTNPARLPHCDFGQEIDG